MQALFLIYDFSCFYYCCLFVLRFLVDKSVDPSFLFFYIVVVD